MFQTAQVSMNQKDLYLFNKSASNDKQGKKTKMQNSKITKNIMKKEKKKI